MHSRKSSQAKEGSKGARSLLIPQPGSPKIEILDTLGSEKMSKQTAEN
jgi:hypothetical protein